MAQLRGRRILITGASSGIGRATARRFAAEGGSLALLGRDRARLREIGAELGAATFSVDLADSEAVTDTVRSAAEQLDGLDGIVNAAGVALTRPFEAISMSDWTEILRVNLTGPFVLCQAALPYLRLAGHATVVTVSSAVSILPAPFVGMSAYAASKGGLNSLTKALAVELGPTIRVNAVCPGTVGTQLLAGHTEEQLAVTAERYALKRIATPDEIANVALFLTSDQSSFMTGCLVPVDGGRVYH